MPSIPTIGVVIPCRNEARSIEAVLSALADQDRRPDDLVVVDDGSTDDTGRVVTAWARAHPGVPLRLVAGPGRGVAAAVNAGIEQLRTDIIVRLDGHCRPAADYLRRAAALLESSDVGVAGGPWTIAPGASTLQARGIAIAVEHPFGSGGAAYRRASREAAGHRPQATGQPAACSPQPAAYPVDTVPFGCFRRALWQELGGLDERLQANEDYEFNFRVRKRGLRVVLDPAIRCTYYARPTLSALARQYYGYGWWKARMLEQHPESARLRHVIPIMLTPGLLVGAIGLALLPSAPWTILLAAYPALVVLGALHAAVTRRQLSAVVWIAGAFFTLQMMWSAGFWASRLRGKST